jgi:integrase
LGKIDKNPFTFIQIVGKWVPVTQRLTQSFVDLQAGDGSDRIVFDSQVSGLGLRITPTGTRIYVAQSRVGGRKRRITLGFAMGMTLAQARTEAQQTLAAMRGGVDPAADRKARLRAAAAMSITIRELSERWIAEFVIPKLKPRTAADYEQLLAKHILPALGALMVAEIDRDHVERLHLDMARTARRANYTVATVRALLNFAIKRGLRAPGSNPASGIKMFRERARERFLSETEMSAAAEGIAQAERAGKIGPHAAAGLRLALFTGARSGEITAAQWSHLDLERKLVRLPDSKTNEPRTIHLSPAALEVVRTIPRIQPYIIAGAKHGEPFKNLSRSWIVAREYAGLGDVRLHDLRHSYASLAAGRGVSLQMIGKLLGHRVPATTQRYAHLARDAVAAVNDELGEAIQAAITKKPAPSGKVVKLPKRR